MVALNPKRLPAPCACRTCTALRRPRYTTQLLSWCAAVEQRLADWTMTPIWNGEGLQVLRYRKEQKYDSHVSTACA